MSVFMENKCKFIGCDANFDTLWDLIFHIEYTHIGIGNGLTALGQNESTTASPSIPMSCVLRFFPETSLKELNNIIKTVDSIVLPTPQPQTDLPAEKKSEEDFPTPSPSEDSDDSFTQNAQFTSDYILKNGKKMNNLPNPDDKKFVCPVPGCEKRYKNINGIKYHSKNGHKVEAIKPPKIYKCHCGKVYKTKPGLKTHSIVHQTELQPIPSPVTPQTPSPQLDTFTPPSPYKYPTNNNTKYIRAALERALPPFNVLQNNNNKNVNNNNINNNSFASEYNGYVDNLGLLTPVASPPVPLPLPADKMQMQYPHPVLPQNPGYYPRVPMYHANYETQHYPVSNNVMME